MLIRRFCTEDAEVVSNLICRNLLEVNIQDYSLEEMKFLVKKHEPKNIIEMSKSQNMYVLLEEDKIIGTGSIGSLQGSRTESILLTIFILPEYHNMGCGKIIIENLEKDEYFTRANRVEVLSSITAYPFYEKMGYRHENGVKFLRKEGNFRMEKVITK